MTGACRILPMGRRLTSVLAAIALVAGAAGYASAAEEEITWYAVEMIVFERTGDAGRTAEDWPAQPGLPNLADAIELSVDGIAPEDLSRNAPSATDDATQLEAETIPKPMTAMPRAYRLLPPEEYRLTDIRDKLERSSAFHPLLQVAWVQPGYPLKDAPLVHLRNANAALGTVGSSGPAAAPLAVNDAGFATALSPHITVARDASQPALDGTVRVHRARYLHVEADLLYYRPSDGPGQGNAAGAPQTSIDSDSAPLADSPDTAFIEQLLAEDEAVPRLFRLTEQRRMRSNELHYLDHPMFGVLVEAWPLELPEAPADPLPAESQTLETPEPAPASTQGQSATGG